MSSVPVISILRKWNTRLKTGINKVSRISLNEFEFYDETRQYTSSLRVTKRLTLYLAQSNPRNPKRSANSGKVTCSIRQSMRAGMSGSTTSPVVPTIRLNAKRACQRLRQSKRTASGEYSTNSISNDNESAHSLRDRQDSFRRLLEHSDPLSSRSRRPRAQIRESLRNISNGHDEMMRLVNGVVVCCRLRRRSHVRLETGKERSEDGAEEGDLLLRNLVENRNERSDRFEEVELGVEAGGGAGGFRQRCVGGRIGVEDGVDDEEVLWYHIPLV